MEEKFGWAGGEYGVETGL